MLIEAGADVNNVNDKNGETILMIASRLGYDKSVEVLIGKGADVNSVDKEGNTALILSARQEPHVIVCECNPEPGTQANQPFPVRSSSSTSRSSYQVQQIQPERHL